MASKRTRHANVAIHIRCRIRDGEQGENEQNNTHLWKWFGECEELGSDSEDSERRHLGIPAPRSPASGAADVFFRDVGESRRNTSSATNAFLSAEWVAFANGLDATCVRTVPNFSCLGV